MATAAPISSAWIPEDDLLLKNAVEAGASLEALSKGAVQFSRKFTFCELQNRWHSLLYDPDISAQASTHMFELELSGFNPFSRNNRVDHSKGSREVTEKRKVQSIRKQYYSTRKRLRSEFFNPIDLGFLDEPNLHERSGHVAKFHRFDREPQDGNFLLGNSIQNHFQFQEAEIDILGSAISKPTRNASDTSGAISTHILHLRGCCNTLEDKHPNGMPRTYGFAANVNAPLRQDEIPFESNVEPRVLSSFIKDGSVNFNEHSSVQESGLQRMLSDRKLLENSQMQQLSVFDSTKENPQNVFCGSRQEHDLHLPSGNSSCHTLDFSSAQPNLSLWEPVEDFSGTPLPVSLKQADATQDTEKMLADHRSSKGENSFIYNAVHSGPSLGVSEAVLEDPDSLLNLSNEDEILLIDTDGKETLNMACSDNCNSLLSSPNSAGEDGIDNLESATLVVSETCLADPGRADLDMSGDFPSCTHGGHQDVHHPELNEPDPSTSVLTSDSYALGDGSLCCILNTEDPEIPCNDDIFLLIHPSTSFGPSAAQPSSAESMDLASGASKKQPGQGINSMMDVKDHARSSPWLQKIGQSISPETRPACSLLGFGVKHELPDTNSVALLSRDANKALRDVNYCRSSNSNPSISTSRVLEDDISRVELKAGETPAAFVEATNMVADPVKIDISQSMFHPSTSDQEESQSDDDVPYFSDIEAMILEMDLDPHDQDSHNLKQVSRYPHEDTKRTIIRLEQCAESCLQRSMTSQGALAIFFGHHLKHYIRKTQVILGRSTDDVDVDIDLRKEGRANKISRRQALVKMEGNGSFYLKNLGKSLISVNGKSVANGQLICLSPSCLIEVGGMSFVFEVNPKHVRHYIKIMLQKSKGNISKFEWSPDEET